MSSKRIEIVVDAEGNPTIEAFGYTGGECKQATAPFEEAAGTVIERKMKGSECAVTVDVRSKVNS
jgi:hypothetical protein